MIMHITVRRPQPDKEDALLDEMHRFTNRVRTQAGVMSAHTLKDMDTGDLIEIAVWANKEAYLVSLPQMEKFEDLTGLEVESPKVYHLEEI